MKQLVDQTQAAIVLSSSWRLDSNSLAEVEHVLSMWNMKLYGTTCRNSSLGCQTRAEEIVEWLRDHGTSISEAVVLDDLDLTGSLGSSCIVVNGKYGLTDNDVKAATDILLGLSGSGSVEEMQEVFKACQASQPSWRKAWEELEMNRKDRKKKTKRRHRQDRRFHGPSCFKGPSQQVMTKLPELKAGVQVHLSALVTTVLCKPKSFWICVCSFLLEAIFFSHRQLL